ncbi:MAG: DHH family phosphoesterase, partial [Candidatus Omnitrophica bacterium]|nr:DHH family phosphoesterase [Candidatus Omnitrophota bacterium]
HTGLEGDALGSELALAALLGKLGKRAYILNNDRTPDNYSFLPGANRIRHRLNNARFDALFLVDCSNKRRAGAITALFDNSLPVINVDHHIDNKGFGQANWVDPCASSAGEMIFQLFKPLGVKLEKPDAVNIYTAISTDTGSFRHYNTTSTAFNICSELLRTGISPARIHTQIYEVNNASDVAFVATVLSRMKFTANNKIAWTKINRGELKSIEGRHEIMSRILDFAKSINTVKVVVILSQANNGLVKLSFRSKSPINVQKIALIFGGGGHKYASGCTVKGKIDTLEKKVLREIKRVL